MQWLLLEWPWVRRRPQDTSPELSQNQSLPVQNYHKTSLYQSRIITKPVFILNSGWLTIIKDPRNTRKANDKNLHQQNFNKCSLKAVPCWELKQWRTRWGGSLWATSSGSTLFAKSNFIISGTSRVNNNYKSDATKQQSNSEYKIWAIWFSVNNNDSVLFQNDQNVREDKATWRKIHAPKEKFTVNVTNFKILRYIESTLHISKLKFI